MSKSIMQRKDGTCYLCKKLYIGDWQQETEEHHVMFGTADRKLSEHYGLKVYLCLGHHRNSAETVHHNKKMDLILKQDAQKAFEEIHSHEEWMEVFGKNYLDEESGKEDSWQEQRAM